MNRVNPTVAFLVAAVVAVLAFFLPGPAGGVLLLLLAVAAAALMVGAWSRLVPAGRLVRLAIIMGLVAVAVGRLV